MKRIFTLLTAALLLGGLNNANAQIDTLIWEDFQDTANVFVTGWDAFPSGTVGAMNWTNFDEDGIADANARPQEWFLSAPYADADTATAMGDANFVAASSSWLQGYAPGNRNWMITPSFTVLDSTTRLFWKSAPRQTPTYIDGYSILVSTTDNNETSFTNQIFCAGQYLSGSGGIDSLVNYTFDPAGCFVHGEDGMFIEPDPTSTNVIGVLRSFEVNLWQFIGQDIYIAFLHNSDDDNLISVDDIGVIKTTVVNSVDDLAEKFNLNAYPNPANNNLQISFEMPATSNLEIAIYNVLGEKVKSMSNDNVVQGIYNHMFDVSDLAPGVYSVRISAEFGATTTSIIVE
ncbi:MAG: T9SS type A sorting domain-containing protein [Bacteroidia bacterium]|nr:T9SS type A sorting domain-containing protein [Bacteroidia bacterium]